MSCRAWLAIAKGESESRAVGRERPLLYIALSVDHLFNVQANGAAMIGKALPQDGSLMHWNG